MLKEIQEAIKLREEVIEFGGKKLVIREVAEAAELGISKEADEDAFYKLVAGCVFEAVPRPSEPGKPEEYEAGEPALTVDDVPGLKAGSRRALSPLFKAVRKVCGLLPEEEIKN